MCRQLRLPILISFFIAATSMPVSAELPYTTEVTSGPFLIAPQAASVDWVVVNNDGEPADIRITVYKLVLGGGPKSLTPAGRVSVTLNPGEITHNANSVGSTFLLGHYYEVVVESTSDNVHPNVNQWSTFGSSGFIPGTLIPAGDFVEIKYPPEKGKRCSDEIDNDRDGFIDGADSDCK